MSVGGDPDGIRHLQSSYGAAAGGAYSSGSTLSRVCEVLNPQNWVGPAGEQARAYTAWLNTANTAMARAFETVASFLPSVADAVEETQSAEKAEIKAADACTKAQQTLSSAEASVAAAQTNLTAARAAASAPHSPFASPQGSPVLSLTDPFASANVSTAEAELAQAERSLSQAKRAADEAETALRRAKHRFEQDNDHRLSLLSQLSSLCHREVASIQSLEPTCPVPDLMVGLTGGLAPWAAGEIDTIRTAERDLTGIPAIARSWLAPALLPQLRSILSHPDQVADYGWGGTGGKWNISSLYDLATKPLSSFVRRPAVRSSGGDGWLGWLAAGGVAVGSIGLIVVTDGADTGLVGEADQSLIPELISDTGTAAGIGGISAQGFTVLDDLLHHQSIDPGALALAGASGWLTAAIPVGISSAVLDDAAGLRAVLATRAVAGAATGAGLNAGSQELLFGRVDGPTVAIAAGAGVWAAGWPGPGDEVQIGGKSYELTGSSPAAKYALAVHGAGFPGFVTASTDGSGPPRAHTH